MSGRQLILKYCKKKDQNRLKRKASYFLKWRKYFFFKNEHVTWTNKIKRLSSSFFFKQTKKRINNFFKNRKGIFL